jgi:hypothetical protein
MSIHNHAPAGLEDASVFYDVKAEAFAIGWLILHWETAPALLAQLTGSLIYDERHRSIMKTIECIVADGDQPSSLLLMQRIRDGGLENAVGGFPYLSQLPDDAQRMSDQEAQTFENALHILRGKWALRSCRHIGKYLVDAAEGGKAVTAEFIADIREQFDIAISKAGRERSTLPQIKDCAELLVNPPDKPPMLIEGLLHQGSKLVIGGGSKDRKTWTLMAMGHAVATGTDFLGLPTRKGRVLYINFEVQEPFFAARLAAICGAKGIDPAPGMLDHWCLRGYAANVDELLSQLLRNVAGREYALIIIDPTYKLMGGRDENKAGDVASMLNAFERLAVETSAAIAFSAHFTKGNQAGKESIDRISGSGVFARDPDSIVTLTKHEQDGAFVVDTTLRNLPPLEPFCVQWEYPLMRRTDLDPTKLKQVKGRPPTHSEEELYNLLPASGLTTTEWQTKSGVECGIARSTFHRLRKSLEVNKRVLKSKATDKWTPISKVS